MDYDCSGALVENFMVRPILVDQIRGKQMQDDELVKGVHKNIRSRMGTLERTFGLLKMEF